jgi:hypothetical protein
MSVTLAEKLLSNYLRNIEATCQKFDLIDLFSNADAKLAI